MNENRVETINNNRKDDWSMRERNGNLMPQILYDLYISNRYDVQGKYMKLTWNMLHAPQYT